MQAIQCGMATYTIRMKSSWKQCSRSMLLRHQRRSRQPGCFGVNDACKPSRAHRQPGEVGVGINFPTAHNTS